MPKISALPALSTALDPDFEIPFHNTTSGATEKITLGDLTGYPDLGWVAYVGGSWSYSSYDSAVNVGVITVPSDATLVFSTGMVVKFTQATGGTKYGRVVGVLSSTSIAVEIQPGLTLANEAITAPMYSTEFMPFGLPSILRANPHLWHKSDATSNTGFSAATTMITFDIYLPEDAYLFIEYMGAGNANTATIDMTVDLQVDGVSQKAWSGSGGLELPSVAINEDTSWYYGWRSSSKISRGKRTVRVRAATGSGTWDATSATLTIRSLNDNHQASV